MSPKAVKVAQFGPKVQMGKARKKPVLPTDARIKKEEEDEKLPQYGEKVLSISSFRPPLSQPAAHWSDHTSSRAEVANGLKPWQYYQRWRLWRCARIPLPSVLPSLPAKEAVDGQKP